MQRKGKNKTVHQPEKPDTRLAMRLSECSLDISEHLIQLSAAEIELQKSFKLRSQVKELLEYGLESKHNLKIQSNESVENEDVLRLINMICGGYVEDDFNSYLSYNDFQEKKEEFDILRGIYQNIQKKYKNRKIEESQIKFRSLLLMIYLQENVSKLSRITLEEIFSKNKIVW